MWPHRRQPARPRRPGDSPGKNTGVGCHFLLQCIKVKSESEVAQSCPTLSDPMDCRLPGSSIHGIFQARGLEWGAIAFSLTNTTLNKSRLCIDIVQPRSRLHLVKMFQCEDDHTFKRNAVNDTSYVSLENQLNFLALDFLIFTTEIMMLVLSLLGWRWRSDKIIYVKHWERTGVSVRNYYYYYYFFTDMF